MKLQKYSDFSFLMKMMCLFVLLFLGYQLRQTSVTYANSESESGSSMEKTEIKATMVPVHNVMIAGKLHGEKIKN
jgi:hypothetical protein